MNYAIGRFQVKISKALKDYDCVYIDDAEPFQQAPSPRLSPDPQLSVRRRPEWHIHSGTNRCMSKLELSCTICSEPDVLIIGSIPHLSSSRVGTNRPHNRCSGGACHFDAVAGKWRTKDRAQIIVHLESIDVIGEHLLWLPIVETIRAFGEFDVDTSRLGITPKRLQV
jgi:hypothetical protein